MTGEGRRVVRVIDERSWTTDASRRILPLAVLCISLSGCVSSLLARKVVAPPNKSGIPALFADSPIVALAPTALSAQWRVPVGPPRAELSVAAIEPGDYGFRYDLRLSYSGREPHIERLEATWRPAAQRVPWPGPPRGTVLLHGYLQDKRFVTPWALALAEAGYRCIVVDLRGHGASTGKHISFGVFEARDVSAVLDVLGWRGWDVSRVGVLGVSYGASVGLLAAGRDPRIAAVVAFEPFSSAERAVPELMRAASPMPSSRPRTSNRRASAASSGATPISRPRSRAPRRRCCSCTARQTIGCRRTTAARSRAWHRRAASCCWCRKTIMCRCRCRSSRSARAWSRGSIVCHQADIDAWLTTAPGCGGCPCESCS